MISPRMDGQFGCVRGCVSSDRSERGCVLVLVDGVLVLGNVIW